MEKGEKDLETIGPNLLSSTEWYDQIFCPREEWNLSMTKIFIGVDSMHYLARLKMTDPALAEDMKNLSRYSKVFITLCLVICQCKSLEICRKQVRAPITAVFERFSGQII